jgi:hypothetical protein
MTLVDRVPRKLAEPIIRDRFIAFVHVVDTAIHDGRRGEVGGHHRGKLDRETEFCELYTSCRPGG